MAVFSFPLNTLIVALISQSVLYATSISVYVMWHQGTQSYATVQSLKAVSAYFTSKQILPFGFAEQYALVYVIWHEGTQYQLVHITCNTCGLEAHSN